MMAPMSAATRLLRRAFALPAPRTPRVDVARDVAVPMPDGVVLRHDHHRPAGVPRGPVVLVRSPYGRASWVGLVFGRLVAERGHQVVVQSVRGTAGSGGTFSPFDEADDGVATVRWLLAQPWCDGRIGTLGPSYLGLTQWALAPDSVPALRVMGTLVTASQFRDQTYPGGSFSLDNALSWAALVRDQARGPLAVLRRRSGLDHRLARAFASPAPLRGADVAGIGEEVGFFRDWLREDAPDSAYWARRSTADRVGEVAAGGVEVTMTGGWQDIFLPWQLADHAALRAAGARPRLVVGPWVHTSPGGMAAGLREALAAFDRHLGPGDAPTADDAALAATRADAPVRLTLSGDGGDRALADWPPPARTRALHLRADRTLTDDPPTDTPPGPGGPGPDPAGTTIRYDPHDPTPAVGGPILGGRSGPRPQESLEARPDVAVFTGAVLERDLVVVGTPGAVIHLTAPVAHLDVFVRVCDVDGEGRSVNVTDGLRRVAPGRPGAAADGSLEVAVELWPTGHRFAAGHRVRVQVSGGAHPRFARHPGTDAPLGEADALVPRDREILHDATHPSRVDLPVEQPGAG